MLEYAAAQSIADGGRTIYLSATPPAGLRRAAERGNIAHAKVPVRYHRKPLPVPRIVRTRPSRGWVKRGAVPVRVRRLLEASVARGAQVFVFVPAIKLVEPIVLLLRDLYPDMTIEGTSSKDPLRADKVRQFREGAIGMLVTTTILERGVTIPKTDVWILDADSPNFDSAALVQMAGRAGRSAADPAGAVNLTASSYNKSQQEAVRQILGMNRLAKAGGYLAVEENQGGMGGRIGNSVQEHVHKMIRYWQEKRDSLLAEGSCRLCRGRLKERRNPLGLCEGCYGSIPWIRDIRCNRCGRGIECPDCMRRQTSFFRQNRGAVRYDDTMREWLALWKYRGDERLAELMSDMLMHAFRRYEQAGVRFDLITFVPVSEKRLRERGFNQAERLARGLGRKVGLPVIPMLDRIVHTDKQSQKSRAARFSDLESAFTLKPVTVPLGRSGEAPSILIVDDVYTTGSTLNQCARIIAEAGGAQVFGLTWAR